MTTTTANQKDAALKNLRACCFTVHDFTDDQITKLKELVTNGTAKYLVFQHELTPTTNKEHIQGYVEFHGSVKWNKINTVCGFRAHIEPRRGTPKEAADYCKKQDTRKPNTVPFEDGTMSQGQGSRSDLLAVKDKIDNGQQMPSIYDEHFATAIRYGKALEGYAKMVQGKRNHNTICICLTGVSRTGKSRLARELWPNSYWATMGNTGLWWDEFHNQESVVFDEFNGGITFSLFKRLIDRYPMTVDTKGGQRNFGCTTAIFTSNSSPKDWYRGKQENDEDAAAFNNRIHIWLEAQTPRTLHGHDTLPAECIIHKVFIPYGASMPVKWCLPGLNALESALLIADTTDDDKRRQIASHAKWVRNKVVTMLSRGNEVPSLVTRS